MTDTPKTIGRYQILAELGRGGMGMVYKAVDPNIDRVVALKVISLAFQADEELKRDMRERFRREAKAAGVLQHHNIVTVYDADEDQGTPFIAMEYVEGQSLDKLMGPDQALPIKTANSIVRQVAQGLAAAHQKGIIHRDIKPANILVTQDGVAKLMDFGIARIADSELTQAGTVIGSPSYMSPEQLTGQAIDHRTDIFSLGVVLYQLLTGERPFAGDNPTSIAYRVIRSEPTPPSELNPVIPPEYDQILTRALAKRPDDRYASAQDMADDLARVVGEGPGEGTTVIVAAPAVLAKLQAVVRNGWIISAAAAVVLALALSLTAASMAGRVDPFAQVRPLIKDGKHDAAAIELLKVHVKKPKDFLTLHLLGHEYLELDDYHSGILVYLEALKLHPEYATDNQVQDDLIAALAGPDSNLAISVIAEKVRDPIKEKLKKTLSSVDYNQRRNAAEALRELGENVDELTLLLTDLKSNPDCELRRKAVEALGELRDKRALQDLEGAKAQNSNINQCPGMLRAIDQAMGKINEIDKPKTP
jgi:predicted Ser/Thr protein kinase